MNKPSAALAFLQWIIAVYVVAKARDPYATGEELPLGHKTHLSAPKIRGRGSSTEDHVARSRRQQTTWHPDQSFTPINPTSQADPYALSPTLDDDYSYSSYFPAYPGKGKVSYQIQSPIGKGEGSGGIKGAVATKSQKGSKGSKGAAQPHGKGKGRVPSPSYDDRDYGIGSVNAPPGEGKGSLSPPPLSFPQGKGKRAGPALPPGKGIIGKGQGSQGSGSEDRRFFPVSRPLEQFNVGPYPGIPPAAGKGKGTYPIFPPADGKGSYPAHPSSNHFHSSRSCKLRWDGAAPIPENMWLGTFTTYASRQL
jgi:hypothetical protein